MSEAAWWTVERANAALPRVGAALARIRDLVAEARTLGVTDVLPKQDCSVEQLLGVVEQGLTRPPEPRHRQPAPSRNRRSMVGAGA